MHQLLRQGVRLHAAALHAVPRGLRAVQDPPAPRQDQVLQVHLALVGEEGRSPGEGGAEVTRAGGRGLADGRMPDKSTGGVDLRTFWAPGSNPTSGRWS